MPYSEESSRQHRNAHKKWIMEIFYLIHSLAHCRHVYCSLFFIWWWFFCSWLFLLEGFLAFFFWIQFRLKLFLPSFFFPRITFIFFSCLIIISMVCVHNGTECFLSTKKENFLLVLLHIAHFFVCSRWIRHCIEAKKTKE